MATEYPPLGKSYVVSYANNNRDFPIIGIRKDPRVDNYKIPEDLSPHPDSVRYPNHVFTGANPTNSDERVLWVYEILPAPWVPFTRYDDDLGPIQGRRRSVKNEGQVASLTADKRVTYEARESSAIVYTELEESWSIKVDDDGNSLFPVRVRDFYDEARGAVQETRQLMVPDGSEEGSISNQNGVITKVSYDVYNEYLAFKIVETWKENGELLSGGQTGTWGVESTERTLVPSDEEVEYGFGIKSGQLVPVSKEQSEKRLEKYPQDSDGDGVIYTLTGQEEDESTGAIIRVTKSLVDASRAISYANSLSGIVEIQPLDKWHSITIATKIEGSVRAQSWTETGRISLPNQLVEVGVIWDSNFTSDAGAAGVENISIVEDNNLSWSVKATCSIEGKVVGASYTKIKEGYSGPAVLEVTRTFHNGIPPTSNITIQKFEPVYGTVTIVSASANNSATGLLSGSGNIELASASNIKFNSDYGLSINQFGPVEHDGIQLKVQGDDDYLDQFIDASAGSVPAGNYPTATAQIKINGVATLEIPTSSKPLTSGKSFILNVSVKPWRLGWWVREVYTAYVP